LNNSVCLMASTKSSGTSDASRLGVVENVRRAIFGYFEVRYWKSS
jgi:hypothetical protein